MAGLLQDSLFHAWAQGTRRSQVHLAAKKRLQVLLQGSQSEQTHRAVELDQQIDIAIRAGFVTGHRAEQRQRLHAKLFAQFVFMLVQDGQDIVSFHLLIVPQSQNAAGCLNVICVVFRLLSSSSFPFSPKP